MTRLARFLNIFFWGLQKMKHNPNGQGPALFKCQQLVFVREREKPRASNALCIKIFVEAGVF